MFIKKSNINIIVKNILFFAVAKGIAFLAPIFLIKFISLEQYGLIEYSYATGSVIAVALLLGLGGAYPYFILKKKEKDKEQAFFLYGALILLLFILFGGLYHISILDRNTYFIFLFSAIFSLQRLYSSILKCNDKGYIGVLYDSGYYFILAVLILLCLAVNINNPLQWLQYFMESYMIGLIAVFFVQYRKHANKPLSDVLKYDCREILKYSVHLIISGFIIYWLTSSARIYIKIFMGYEQIGIYSFYFRMVGISVALYQFCYIAFFKKLYLSNTQKLDIYYAVLMFAVFAFCLIFFAASPVFIEYLLPEVAADIPKLFLLLCFQMPVWVGIALCEGLIARENVVKRMNIGLGIMVVVFPVLLLILKEHLKLELFTYLHIMAFCISFAYQIYILHKKNVSLRLCLIFNIAIIVMATIIYWF
jgi:O-antigen/teichoic acid export membrane protein